MDTDLQKTLEIIRQLDFSGNIIPHTWFKTITYPNGKPDLLGMMILAEIVYWYRPVPVKEEGSGRLLGYRKKFKGDMLQRSQVSFAEQFGVSRRQVMEAMKRLEEGDWMIKSIRDVKTSRGKLGNVLFVAPNAQKLLDLQSSTPLIPSNVQGVESENEIEKSLKNKSLDTPYPFESTSLYDQTYDLMQSNVPPCTFERMTYTEITKENNKDIINNKKCSKNNQFKNQSSLPSIALLTCTTKARTKAAALSPWIQYLTHAGLNKHDLRRQRDLTQLKQLVEAIQTTGQPPQRIFQQALERASQVKPLASINVFYLTPIVEQCLTEVLKTFRQTTTKRSVGSVSDPITSPTSTTTLNEAGHYLSPTAASWITCPKNKGVTHGNP